MRSDSPPMLTGSRDAGEWRLPAMWLVLLIAGCTRGGGGAVPTMTVDTVGTRIEVRNTGTAAWTAETAWHFEEDLRLGTAMATGDASEQFGSIRSIASDSQGRIFVLDGMVDEIRVFGPTGAYSHSIGGHGRGPGEFSGASALDVGRGDTLTVLDDGLMRFSVFAPDGTLVANHRRDIVGVGAPLRSSLRDGGYLDWALAFPDGRFGARVLLYPVRYAPGLERADTFSPIEAVQRMVSSGRMPLLDFGGFPVASADRTGIVWFAHPQEYRIFRRGLEGDTTLEFRLRTAAAPLGEPEREYVRRRWSNRPDILAEQLEALPETKPIIYGIVPDNAGHVLVFVDVAGEETGTVVDVFREDGEFLGRVKLPIRVPLRPGRPPVVRATRDYLYAVVEDEMEIPYVSRLRKIEGRQPSRQ
jgi:hypothetical protein